MQIQWLTNIFTYLISTVICLGCLVNSQNSVTRGVEAPRSTAITDCGIRKQAERLFPGLSRFRRESVIVGGEPAKYSWPWMVLLGRKRGGRNDFFCGGAIINDNYVITAAHCVLALEPFFARVGEHDYAVTHFKREDINVEDVIFHPKYKLDRGYHDIALLKLAKKITFNDHVKPVCLPWGNLGQISLINQSVKLIGWGRLGYNDVTPSVLHEVSVRVFHPSACSESYSTLPDYPETFPQGMTSENILCAGHIKGGKDSCDGDSGGPVVHYEANKRYTLAAVISKGFGCGKKDFPGLNAPIRNHETLQWIKRVAFQ